uniref:F-box domain-containing protein n=1 Tax=Haptolina ericina TaxID=156174 RepID=A0A7S3BU01_9EUKA|mmetsp:Transcript_67408/g.150427  ORF Transcript_67408/g.150427 Transcript_67408/m.150427 type:complete len:374 (+) Transcript_67408:30-1151(+)
MSRRSGSSPQNYNRPTTRACLRATVNTALLSPDILSTVMVWLGVPDLARVTRVCHAWKEAATLRLRDSRRSRGLYAVGGCYGGPHPSSSLSLSTVQRYNPTTGTTHSLAALSQGRDHLGLAATGGQLYAIGGWTGSRNCATVEVYDPLQDQWQTGPRLTIERSGLGVAVGPTGSLLAVGGWGGDGLDYLSSVEEYNPSEEKWEALSDLQTPRHCPGVAVLGHWLYVCGGLPGHALARLSTVERLDLDDEEAGAWEVVAPMHMPRYRHALAALDGKLYAVGGETATADNGALVVTSSVEMFDPALNTWQSVTPLCRPRMSHAVAVFDGCLLALGGFDGSHWLDSAERYEPLSGRWEEMPVPGFAPRCAQGLAVC